MTLHRSRRLLACLAVCATLFALPATAHAEGDGTDVPQHRPTVYLAGDSTMASYGESVYPLTGWGQVVNEFFTNDVVIDNRAIGGRSSKSYVLEGHLDKILADIRPGDYLFFQWGHNDNQSTDSLCRTNPTYCNRHTSPYTSYKEYLQKYIDGARAHGATPVVISPMGRRNYDSDGTFNNDFADYTDAAKQLAVEQDTAFIDLNAKSIAFYDRIGPPATEEVFLYCEPQEYPAYPTGRQDNVHFQEYGARQLAKLVAEGVVESQLPIAQYVVFPGLDRKNVALDARPTASSSLEADGWYLWDVSEGAEVANEHALGWSSDSVLNAVDHTEWVQLDLGLTSRLRQIQLVPRNDEGNVGASFPVDFTIQTSVDGETWTTVADVRDHPVPTGTESFEFAQVQARYIKVVGTQLRPDPEELNLYRMRLTEIKAYRTAA